MRFAILGPLEVVSDNRDLTPSAPKLRQVLALLVLRHDRLVRADDLIDEIWGPDPPSTALATLQTYIYKVRRALTPDGDPAGPGQKGDIHSFRVHTRPSGYLCSLDCADLDLWQFERLLKAGQAALDDDDPGQGAEVLSQALELWRGPALADVPLGELLSAQAAQLEERRLMALELRAEADLRLGRHAELISELRSLTAVQQLHEGFHAKLMLALHRANRRSEALEVYQRLRHRLVDDLGLDPSTALRQLHQAVLRADPALDLAGSATGATPAFTGEHPVHPAQLPPDIADFQGRHGELSRIEERVEDRSDRERDSGTAVRVLSITGMPGAGKTALVTHAAHRVSGRFPGGQLFVDLRGSSGGPADPAQVLSSFLFAVGVERVPDGLDERSKLFRSWSATRSVLVVLDDAEGVEQVQPLIPSGARCAALITSRSGLYGLPGAYRIELGGLTVQEGTALLAEIIGSPQVSTERRAAETVVELCGGLPLAIRSAGARFAASHEWHLAQWAERLRRSPRRLDELSFAGLDVRTHYQSSYRGLTGPAQRAFRLLSRLPGPAFTLAHARALLGCDTPTAQALLAPLLERNLLQVSHSGAPDGAWYSFHNLIRSYAQELAIQEESRQIAAENTASRPRGAPPPADPMAV